MPSDRQPDAALGADAQKHARYIGLISGTSMDGIDAVLVSFDNHQCELHAAQCIDYPKSLSDALRAAVAAPDDVDVGQLGELDVAVADAFAQAALELAAKNGAHPLTAIGSHGQTVFHAPPGNGGFSMQLGDPARIAALTGIITVGGFRNADMALGGEGAPLVPAFHAWLLSDADQPSAVVNLGGIANITRLDQAGAQSGFDTGPANTLLDIWYARHHAGNFDTNGRWAGSGDVSDTLLEALLADPYFGRPPPKSTGREYFNADWLDARLSAAGPLPSPADIQATLAELTAASVANAIVGSGPAKLVAVCGGGARNADLLGRLSRRLTPTRVITTDKLGLAADWVEACAFAWLARERLAERCSNVPAVTGALGAIPLGGVFLPPGGGL